MTSQVQLQKAVSVHLQARLKLQISNDDRFFHLFVLPTPYTLDAIAHLLLGTEASNRVLKDAFNLIIQSGQHGYVMPDILCKTGEHAWTTCDFHLHLILPRHRAKLSRPKPLGSAKPAICPFLWGMATKHLLKP